MVSVSVLELKRAWQAVAAGEFADASSENTTVSHWRPKTPVLPVLGAHGQAGASTVALALATAAAPAWLVGCASSSTCGLVGAAATELGEFGAGWARGSRGDVVIDRFAHQLSRPSELPAPRDLDQSITQIVVDAGWEATQVLRAESWLSGLMSSGPVVVVTGATIPGFRRLESILGLLRTAEPVVAVIGPPLKRWPKVLSAALGARTREVIDAGRLVALPVFKSLQVAGLTPDPLPPALVTCGAEILRFFDVSEASVVSTEKEL